MKLVSVFAVLLVVWGCSDDGTSADAEMGGSGSGGAPVASGNAGTSNTTSAGSGATTPAASCDRACSADDPCFPENATCIQGGVSRTVSNCIEGCCFDGRLQDLCDMAFQ